MITKRKSGLKTSSSAHAEIAETGAAKARPIGDRDERRQERADGVHRAERGDDGEIDAAAAATRVAT